MKFKMIFLGLFSLLIATACSTKTTDDTREVEDAIATWQASLFYEMQNELGEGAFWNDRTGELWHIDIEGRKFFTTDVPLRSQVVYDLDQRIGTVVPADNGQAILALEDGIYAFDTQSRTQVLLVSPEDSIENIRFNDGKCDPAGRLWVGSMGLEQKPYRASLYCIAGGQARQQLDSITISNGIVWSSDQKTMYYIDTPDENVKAFDYDVVTGNISNERVVIEIGGLGYPDGMAIDEEDMLWIALWNGNKVVRWNPKTGNLIGQVEVPAHNITSCTFGGANLDSLFITSARVDMTEEEQVAYPLAGSVFVVVPGIKGVKGNFYKM